MNKNYMAVALVLFGSVATRAQEAARAGQKQPVFKEVADNGSPVLLRFAPGSQGYAYSESAQAFREQLGLRADDRLQLAKTESDALGFVHEKYQQYYKGVKVEHATYSLHARQGNIESLSGAFKQIESLNTTPSLTEAAALAQALAFVGARKYRWESTGAEVFRPVGELVIVENHTAKSKAQDGQPTLAWKFNIYAEEPVSRAYIYVDAHTGQVVLKDDIIKHATPATATFATAYSGTRSLADETATGGYHLREYTRGNGIETYNMRKGTNYSAAVDFVDADNNWTAAEYNNSNYDNVAGDAHFGAQSTYDYWKAVHNRNSYDNNGATIKSYVHYSSGYENAYWDGTEMTYGDGASTFKPLTALDVCGHEIGHAVCENTANLTYQGESGAMNEGFSDCWGASIEKYTVDRFGLTGKSTWDIGEEIMKAGGALRSMSNPNLYNQPAYYKGQYWYSGSSDNGGVHTNSGVLNYWYYLVSAGKTGTNEKGNSFSVTGLGLSDAAKILFRTESVYLTSSATYANARTYSIQAATDLFGATSQQVQSVTNAWYAVGIGAAYNGGTTPPPTGGGGTVTYCTSKGNSVSYEYIKLVQLGSINRSSGADGGYYDGTALNTGLTAGSSYTISYQTGFTGSGYAEYFRIYADWNQNGSFTDAGEALVSSTNTSVVTGVRSATFSVPTGAKNGKTRLRVVMSDNSATNSCGTYSYGETEDYSVTVSGGTTFAGGNASLTGNGLAQSLEVYPNPTSDVLRLSLGGNAPVQAVEVFDARGARVEGIRYGGDNQVDVSRLAAGLYTVKVSDGQQVYHQRFAKQ